MFRCTKRILLSLLFLMNSKRAWVQLTPIQMLHIKFTFVNTPALVIIIIVVTSLGGNQILKQ